MGRISRAYLLQGTLELLVLRALAVGEWRHGYAIADWIHGASAEVLSASNAWSIGRI